jgi:hypothetical protein
MRFITVASAFLLPGILSEGPAERVGDLVPQCAQSRPGALVRNSVVGPSAVPGALVDAIEVINENN